jgi:hypothetical protein
MSSYNANWNYSITDDEEDVEDLSSVELSQYDVEQMFKPIDIPSDSICEKRFMTMDMATTGFDNLILKYWEKWSKCGFICRDIKYSTNNSNREAVIMAMRFRDKHNLQEREMILDVQGFGFLRDCFPKSIQFTGAGAPSKRAKAQFRTMKDEAGHIAMEMIRSGLIHYEPKLAQMHYSHKNMKREGGTTILRHMLFESKIFQFHKTPNGRLSMLNKDQMKTILKGMSPDLTDNIILLCGGVYNTCYNELRDNAGVTRRSMQSNDMLSMLNVNGSDVVDTRVSRVQKSIRNASEILNVLSHI